MIVHRDLKPANLMLGGIPHETGTREMVRWLNDLRFRVYLRILVAVNYPSNRTWEAGTPVERLSVLGSGSAGRQREDRGFRAEPIAGHHSRGQQARQHYRPGVARQAGAAQTNAS